MDRIEVDKTPAEEWQASLNATCNRLSTHYLNLLIAASSTPLIEEMNGKQSGKQDPRCELLQLTFRAYLHDHSCATLAHFSMLHPCSSQPAEEL
jgi:hypothetical protein